MMKKTFWRRSIPERSELAQDEVGLDLERGAARLNKI
jgi:hypothetical protein